jgi:hypothetical protein
MNCIQSHLNKGSPRGAKRRDNMHRDRHEKHPWIFFWKFLKSNVKKEYLEVKLTNRLIQELLFIFVYKWFQETYDFSIKYKYNRKEVNHAKFVQLHEFYICQYWLYYFNYCHDVFQVCRRY